MTPKRNRLLKILALCLVVFLCLPFAACKEQKGPDGTQGASQPGVETTYSLAVKTQGGAPLAGISIYVYENDTLQDMIAVVKTDEEGNASFVYKSGTGYVAVLGNVPEGYQVEKSYPITGENMEIVLSIALVQGDLETASYKLGDVMMDFTFTDMNGEEHTLSQMLQEKKAVLLSFWVLENNQCKMEMPYLQEAYAEYTDSIEVLAMNPLQKDQNKIREFAQQFGLTMPVGACDEQWSDALHILGYPATVVIDRYGTIVLTHVGGFKSATEFKDVMAFFTAEDYVQKIVENYEDILVSEPENDYNNPVDISGQSSFQLTIDPGKIHYLNIHKVSNVLLQVGHADIFVEYGSKKYTSNGSGGVSFLVSAPSTFEPAQLGFGNSGTETVTFTVTLSNLAGTQGNPYSLKLGEFTSSTSAGNNQGVYFRYTAPEDGYFSLQCLNISPAVAYDFSVMNLTTSAMRNMSSDGQEDAETGNKAVVVPMNKGEQVSVILATLPDESYNYPSATFKMLAKFTAGEVEDVVVVEKMAYAVTITDENGNPVQGVSINLTGTIPEIPPVTEDTEDDTQEDTGSTVPEPTRVNLATDENGVASAMLAKDTYTGSLIIPEGYKATTTTFTLTEEIPFTSLKIDTYVLVMEDYTVRVIDEEGAPVPGTLITIGTTFGTTDSDGVFTANLEKGEYTVIIGAPAGYVADAISVPFPEDTNVLGVTLHKGSGEQSGIPYTVKVVDANGAAMTDILVIFNQFDEPVTMVPVDSTGTAVANLEPGEYSVTLTSSSGSALKFDKTLAELTEDKTSTTLTVAVDLGNSSHMSAYWGNYYKVLTGSTWLDLSNTLNYSTECSAHMYAFYPAVSGVYRFSCSSGVVLGHYGSVSFVGAMPSKSTDNEDGYFEITIMDGEFANENQPAYVLGVVANGLSEATITVVRVGDAPAELPRVTYEPTSEIKPFTATGTVNPKYVSLTGTVNVQKKDDGYYVGSKKLYINLSNSAPYLTVGNMLGVLYDETQGQWVTSSMGTGMKGLIYEGTEVVAVEDFTDCMSNYVRASDPVTGLYPLNDDIVHMIQSCGTYMGWWNSESPNYLFESVTGMKAENGWLFAVCTIN